jgi:hypothetical protein
MMEQKIQKKYFESAKRALSWLEKKLKENGKISDAPFDLACYYNVPMFLLQHGKEEKAHSVLDFIHQNFMQENGDFFTSHDYKSENPLLNEFWCYTNGWIAQAAQKLGRFDISYPAWRYLRNYYNPDIGGWKTRRIPSSENPLDLLSTAHLGFTSLYFADLDNALKAGQLLQNVLLKQQTESKLHLRLTPTGRLIKDAADDNLNFAYIDPAKPQSAYFILGYAMAFLTKLYQTTSDLQYLESAELCFNWLSDSPTHLKSTFFSHKLAWGAACLAGVTADPKALELTYAIADSLVFAQDEEGTWEVNEEGMSVSEQTVGYALLLSHLT